MTASAVVQSGGSTGIGRLVLLGHPVEHSLSPTFQNAALHAAGYSLRYQALDVAPPDLGAALARMRALHAAGNVTVPHKRTVAAACDRLTDVARAVGAVNTFWFDGERLVGDNTDVAGAADAIRAAWGGNAVARPLRRIALLGAGGAAAAVVVAVAEAAPSARVVVWSRRPSAAAELRNIAPPRVEVAENLEKALGTADLVVNATPLGLRANDPPPCSVGALPAHAAVLDLVYGPNETPWVREARAAGHRGADGLLMLVRQGAAAFERWFGHAPDEGAMWRAVEVRTGRTRPAAAFHVDAPGHAPGPGAS